MSVRALLVLVAIELSVFLLLLFRNARRQDGFSSLSNLTQSFFHLAGAVGIAATGLWFVAQRQWAPRTTVEVRPTVSLLSERPPKLVLLQVAIDVTNLSPLSQEFDDIRVAARGYDPNALTDQFGDLAHRPLGEVQLPGMVLHPNEADHAYAEFKISCDERLVQILVKMREPEHPMKESSTRLDYERKAVIPVSNVCAGRGDVIPKTA